MRRDVKREPDDYRPGVAIMIALGAFLAYRGIEVLRSPDDCEVIGHFGTYCVSTDLLGPALLIGSAMTFLLVVARYRRERGSRPHQ